MQIEGHAAASAMQKALDAQQMIAGKTVQSVGSTTLKSPSGVDAIPGAVAPEDRVSISAEAKELAKSHDNGSRAKAERAGVKGEGAERTTQGTEARADMEVRENAKTREDANVRDDAKARDEGSSLQLSPEEKDQVRALQSRDAQVRGHENAHAGAGGALAGSPSYTFETGPDGRQYAVGGEVPISIQSGSTPEESLRNAAQVRSAALAPADPSSADLGVAAAASSLERQARAELARERQEEVAAGRDEGQESSEVGETTTAIGQERVAESARIESEDQKANDQFVRDEADRFDPRAQNYGQFGEEAAEGTRLSLFG